VKKGLASSLEKFSLENLVASLNLRTSRERAVG
jgi:hypothetical protein